MPYSELQYKHLSIWPHFTASLSMIGSGLIIFEVLRSRRKRGKVFHRLMLAMSMCDFNTSFWYFLSTWPSPADTPNVFAAKGTQQTCTAQGFFVQFGIATPFYNAALSLFYLLIIRYQWKEWELLKLEKFFHGFPLVWATATSLAGLGLNLYNHATLWCWFSPYPAGCKGSRENGGVSDCERGNNARIYGWAFFYAPLWAVIILSAIAMYLTYDAVRETEEATIKWKQRADMRYHAADGRQMKRPSKKHSKQVANQAFYYLIAFFFSWTPATLTRLIQLISKKTYFPLIMLMAIFTPMQGFFNFLVYNRPKFMKYRQKHPKWWSCRIFQMLCPCGAQADMGNDGPRRNFTKTTRDAQTTRRGYNFSAVKMSLSASVASRWLTSRIEKHSEEHWSEDEKQEESVEEVQVVVYAHEEVSGERVILGDAGREKMEDATKSSKNKKNRVHNEISESAKEEKGHDAPAFGKNIEGIIENGGKSDHTNGPKKAICVTDNEKWVTKANETNENNSQKGDREGVNEGKGREFPSFNEGIEPVLENDCVSGHNNGPKKHVDALPIDGTDNEEVVTNANETNENYSQKGDRESVNEETGQESPAFNEDRGRK